MRRNVYSSTSQLDYRYFMRQKRLIDLSHSFIIDNYYSDNRAVTSQKIIEFMWLYLFYFSVFLLGFRKLGEQASISSSFQQRLFVFLFLDNLVNGFLESQGFLLQPSFSFFWQSSCDIIQTENLNVLTFLTKLPE